MSTDYERAVRELDASLANRLPNQILDPDREDDGGHYSSGSGFATAAGTSGFIAQLGLAYLTPASRYFEDDAILDRLLRAVAFERRCQRPSGCIDLQGANFDSPPDTAFVVARIAPVARVARESDAAGAGEIEAALRPFLEDAGAGMAAGGFHTANHRWVLVGAMADVHELYPDDALIERIEEYLAEGIDINEDGEYTERSHGVYTNVVNRHLVAAAEALDRPDLLEPVRRSLHTVADLMDEDWTVVTEFSTRQDQGERSPPVRGTAEFYHAARRHDDERLAAAARGLLEAGGWDHGGVIRTLVSYFHRYPEWREASLPAGERQDPVSRRMPDSGLWRIREGRLGATVATGTKNVVALSYGDADMLGLQVTSPYFGGRFAGEEITFGEESATVSLGTEYWHDELPGYFEPLDRPVGWGDTELDARDVDSLPDFDIEVTAEGADGGLDVTVSVTGGLERVPFAIEARFDPGGRIEFESGATEGEAGEASFLGSGHAVYTEGSDAIRIGPGVCEHRIADPPGTDDPSNVTRLLLTDWAPFERTVEIRGDSWLALGGDPPVTPNARAGDASGRGPDERTDR
ncbi:MAG: hypothetical protein ABEH66_01085 [Halobacteriales archaeon]